MKARRMLLISVVTLPTVTAACGGGSPSGDATVAQAAAPRTVAMTRDEIAHAGVRWAPAEAATLAEAVEVPGDLAPNEDRTARLGAPVRARVQSMDVHVGDRVARAQPLVTLVSEEATLAQAEHAKAAANLSARRSAAQYARLALERAERLLELKAIARQDVERARVDREEAQSMYAQAEAEVERTSATLGQLGVSGGPGQIVVRAPLAGVVLTRDVMPGSVVNAGDSLLMITDPSTLWLDIAATERVATTLRPGSRVTFTVPGLAPRTFDAVIENIGGALNPATRTLPLHAVVANPDGVLRPAMFATVMVPLGESRAGVLVPDAAMQLLDQRPVVFIATPEAGGARFERRDVEVGARKDNQVQLLRGIGPGEIVVIEGAFAVKSEFARVKMPVG